MNRLLCLVVLALAAVGAFAQVRSVVGSGSVHATDGTLHHQGTMGQGAIGHARLADGSHRYAGFWYRPRTGVTIVAVPNTEGEVGTRVNIPVMLVSSNNLVVDGPRDFIVKLRYNATVLVHQGTFACERQGDDCILTVRGTMRDSAGTLADVPFLVTLGNADTTVMSIDTVEWVGASTISTEKYPGVFQATGICIVDGVPRLIKKSRAAGIVSVAPMPASTTATIALDIIERGMTKLYLVDNAGKEIVMFDTRDRAPGRQEVSVDVSTISSGTYRVVLMTPSELFTSSMVIRK